MSLADWIFGPRTIKVDCGDRVISEYLWLKDKVDIDKVLEVRTKALLNCSRETFKQEIGLIYGAKTYVEIDFDFTKALTEYRGKSD